MNLSIIITSVDDPELQNTVMSAKETAPDAEIIVVDDASGCPVSDMFHDLPARVVRNPFRCGVGPARTIGVLHATNTNILICDSHMRFLPGWAEIAIQRLKDDPFSVYCCTCLGLDKSNMDPSAPRSRYYGARWNFLGPDANDASKTQVFELVWNKDQPKDNEAIQGVMGGAYFVRKEWFLHLGALKNLRGWGCDEQMLSLKSYLLGGDCRIITAFGIGHRFLETIPRPGGKVLTEKQPYTVPLGYPTFNKLFAIATLTPRPLSERLTEELIVATPLVERRAGLEIFQRDYHVVANECMVNSDLFKVRFDQYLERFGIVV